ncbi:hypothetical protein [Pedobacter sp.]|uniref:hypothetical protein n=1 Tax=Pedobacter sp. TaxID=1411316 RepID=UPI0031E191BF
MSGFIDWLSKYLGIEKTPTATIIVSLTVFSLGIIINETIKAIARFRERKTIREIVRRNYLIFQSYLVEQAESLRKFESLVTVKGGPNFNAHVRPCSALDNYKDISYNNSFKAFFVGLENIKGRTKRIEAFDNLYQSLSTIRIEQERMFPIIASFLPETITIMDRLNINFNDAFEATGDVNMKLRKQQPVNHKLTMWLNVRSEFYEKCFANGDSEDLNKIKDYFLSVIDFETRNRRPLDLIMDEKEFFYYHKKINRAIGDVDALNKLVKNTKVYCIAISEKFEFTAQRLRLNYEFLFRKINNDSV